MKQMVNTEAPSIQAMPFGQLECGFFRKSHGKAKIFFAFPHGKWTFVFPVEGNGLISRRGTDESFHPSELVEVVHSGSLGISEIKWGEN